MTALCRDCGVLATSRIRRDRCDACGSPRQVHHTALHTLSIAHVHCDAFYATVEKRGRPDLADRPVIVGGGRRGIVLACCYVARLRSVRSAMPMFKALAACPGRTITLKLKTADFRSRTRSRRLADPTQLAEAFVSHRGGSARQRG